MLFSISPNNETTLYPSSLEGKYFYVNDLPYNADYLVLRATLHHSLEDYVADGNYTWPHLDDQVIVGICYYWQNPLSNKGEYASVFCFSYMEDQLGETLQCTFAIDDYLDPNVRYYSYAKNHCPTGYIYGNVWLYYMY